MIMRMGTVWREKTKQLFGVVYNNLVHEEGNGEALFNSKTALKLRK